MYNKQLFNHIKEAIVKESEDDELNITKLNSELTVDNESIINSISIESPFSIQDYILQTRLECALMKIENENC
jgi:hypothetical protein